MAGDALRWVTIKTAFNFQPFTLLDVNFFFKLYIFYVFAQKLSMNATPRNLTPRVNSWT